MRISIRQLKRLIKEQVQEAEHEADSDGGRPEYERNPDMRREVGEKVLLKGDERWGTWKISERGNGTYKVEMFDDGTDEGDSGESITVKSLDKAVRLIKAGPSNEPGEWVITGLV